MTDKIDVLLVDDSAVVRGLLAKALETDPKISIAGTAMHGKRALDWMSCNSVDVVILDLEMPVMDGLTALKIIQKDYSEIPVIVASGLTQKGAEITIQALSLGAADCIAKPVARNVSESIEQLVEQLVPVVKALGAKKKSSEKKASSPTKITSVIKTGIKPQSPAIPPQVVVIGSSTGGPKALAEVLTGLPKDFHLPIFIVQHMPPFFTPMLAQHIQTDTGRPCKEAEDGDVVQQNYTYVAPGDYHMVIQEKDDRKVLSLNQSPKECYCRPSVNPLFRSAAHLYGKGLLGVILTGMGEDGKNGTVELVERGGFMIAQDEASSVVWGMPGAVCQNNLANEILPLSQIASSISKHCLQGVYAK